MKPPVRIVCRGCLRSVEIDDDVQPPPSGSCPYCGQAMDSRQGLSSGPSVDPDSLTSVGETARMDRESTSEWIATWTRGSLGVLNRFQLRDRLGDGGFGEVFLAYDPRLDRDVALKVLRQPNPSDRVMERFFREARAAARLDHPNIVAVYDSGFDRGRCWVAYQQVSGKPLWWFFDHQPIAPAVAARLIRDLAEAVDYAHKHGVVHRDIKPANILVDASMRPRLIDFGLARRADLDSSLTHDGAVLGTPAYMSPEQALGFSRQVDERSDVFSLGVVLFEALAGRRPRTTTTIRTPPNGSSRMDAPPPAEDWNDVDATVPPGLVRICRRATADRPEDRFPTARALADELNAWLQEGDRPSSPTRRKSMGLALVAGAAVLTAALFLGYFAGMRVNGSRSQPPASPSRLLDASTDSRSEAPAPVGPVALKLKSLLRPAIDGKAVLIGNRNSAMYHKAACPAVRQISEENRIEIGTPEAAEAGGLTPCKHCHPTDPRKASAGAEPRP
ncbi:serine/threonine-protein kinase [Planctomyces sp. SH-PL62]|uniref:serine/threonine-protein kinase n=1 Tax=Planctomyces sp. SH-PL62 TaxID=1636152 RepID=UPI00078D02B5|nr:serine/threonine-protein kinase [Planctomyces sp. SH-PL62]AMV38964.1 Serine/threonine-protein kinase PknB [Planctomyces sp. SH-PL62]